MITDPIADTLTRIRNAQIRKKSQVEVSYSKIIVNILGVLQEEGYIGKFTVEKPDPKKVHQHIVVDLLYYEKQPVIKGIKRISKPSRRIFSSISDLRKVRNGLGTTILSTSKGVMSDYKARTLSVGGEVLCSVF